MVAFRVLRAYQHPYRSPAVGYPAGYDFGGTGPDKHIRLLRDHRTRRGNMGVGTGGYGVYWFGRNEQLVMQNLRWITQALFIGCAILVLF